MKNTPEINTALLLIRAQLYADAVEILLERGECVYMARAGARDIVLEFTNIFKVGSK